MLMKSVLTNGIGVTSPTVAGTHKDVTLFCKKTKVRVKLLPSRQHV